MPLPIPSLKEADLPARKKSLIKMIGPGVVMAGLAIGSGELIMWPWITSVVGAQLLWAAAIGIFLQLWINIEIGRWSIVTGETPPQSLIPAWINVQNVSGLRFGGA